MIKFLTLTVLLCVLNIMVWSKPYYQPEKRPHYYTDAHETDIVNFLDSILTGKWTCPDSLLFYEKYLDEKNEIQKNNRNVFFEVFWLMETAQTKFILQDFNESYQYINQCIQVLSKKRYPSIFNKVLLIGKFFAMQHGDYETAIQYLTKVEDSGYFPVKSKEMSDVLLDIANCNWSLHNYDESMNYCNKVLPFLTLQNYQQGKISALLLMYHNSHFTTNDTTWSEYLDDALNIALTLKDSAQLNKVYHTIGYSYYRENNQLKAIEYYKLANIFGKGQGAESELSNLVNLQLSYTLSDSVAAVGSTSKYIIEQATRKNATRFLGNAYRSRAWYFAKTGKKDSAVYYLDLAHNHRLSHAEKNKTSPGFYNYLYETALMVKDYERALKFLNISSEQVRQISRENNAAELSQSRAELDYQLQHEKIEKLSLENKLAIEKRKRQNFLLLGFALLLSLGIVFLIFARQKYSQLKNSYHEIFKKNAELDKLNHRLTQTEKKLHSIKNENGSGNVNEIKNEEKIYIQLKELFEKEKIYKQPDLSMIKLANRLNTNTSYLSIIINKRFKESFKTLINKFRINEARRLFKSSDYSNFSIEGIAEEVGYHSRSTFYQSFKQITGLTPTQYIENINSKKNISV